MTHPPATKEDFMTALHHPPVVALGGLMTSGKDTVADRLVTRHGFTKVGMSDALHRALLTLDPWVYVSTTDEALLTDTEQTALRGRSTLRYHEAHAALGYDRMKVIAEVRRLQQTMGTEVGRAWDTDIWATQALRTIDPLLRAGHPVVVTGIRFRNELAMVQRLHAATVYVHRPCLIPGLDTHASETTLGPEDFDVILDNDDTLTALYAKADALARGALATPWSVR
jgi:hypothetical protein